MDVVRALVLLVSVLNQCYVCTLADARMSCTCAHNPLVLVIYTQVQAAPILVFFQKQSDAWT